MLPPPASPRPRVCGQNVHPRLLPPQASQALCALLPVASYRKAVAQLFPQLLMALVLQLFYSGDLRLTTQDRTV